MPHVDLSEALKECPASTGMYPSKLSQWIKTLASDSSQGITISLDDGDSMRFLVHQENGKTILTSVNCLASNCKDGIPMECLPEILTKLNKQEIHFTALQFPHAFMVKGRFTSTSYRAHFNHIVIYKDSAGQLNGGIIDSASNPLGVYNPFPVLGWMASNSILSGEELLQVKLTRLLKKSDSQSALKTLCDLKDNNSLVVLSPTLTYKQPSIGDKRCAIYVLNAMSSLINDVVSDKPVTIESISKGVLNAHQALNEPEMMNISYPESEYGLK